MLFTDHPIRRDFDQFLEYISQPTGIELTKDKGQLRSADLQRLNERLRHKLDIFNPKAQQQSFPLLTTFFHVAKAAQFFFVKKDSAGRKAWLEINEDRVRQYDALTDDEQYFFLLETFWCFVNWEEAYDCRSFHDGRFYLELSQQPAGKSISIADRNLKRTGKIEAPMYLFSAEIFAAFGFFDLVWDEKLTARPNRYTFPYQSAAVSEIGKIMLPILLKKRAFWIWGEQNPFFTVELQQRLEQFFDENESDDNDLYLCFDRRPMPDLFMEVDEEKIEQPAETTFSSAFERAFPGLKVENRLMPIARPFVAGLLHLKIVLTEKCYREIVISAEATLSDLHDAIQSIFKFDNDHLYAFFMSGKENYRAGEVYSDPRGNGNELPASIIRLGELGLYEGKEFLYLFDFGYNWRFGVRVLAIDPQGGSLKKFKVLKTVGDAPKQYPSWDGDDEN